MFIGAAAMAQGRGDADAQRPEIGQVRIRTMQAISYAYVADNTTFDKLGQAIGGAMPQIQRAAEEKKIQQPTQFVLVYPKGSAHRTPDQPFDVHIGTMVAEGSTGGDDVKVRKCEPFKAATVLYMGPVAEIGQCYQKLFPAIERMNLEPTGEEREFTLYFESIESPNNVVLVQVGVKEKGEKR
jgi:effector-binding domain-containing protein